MKTNIMYYLQAASFIFFAADLTADEISRNHTANQKNTESRRAGPVLDGLPVPVADVVATEASGTGVSGSVNLFRDVRSPRVTYPRGNRNFVIPEANRVGDIRPPYNHFYSTQGTLEVHQDSSRAIYQKRIKGDHFSPPAVREKSSAVQTPGDHVSVVAATAVKKGGTSQRVNRHDPGTRQSGRQSDPQRQPTPVRDKNSPVIKSDRSERYEKTGKQFRSDIGSTDKGYVFTELQPNRTTIQRDVVKYDGDIDELITVLEENDLPYEINNRDEFILGREALNTLVDLGIELQKVAISFSSTGPTGIFQRNDEGDRERNSWFGSNYEDIPIPDNLGNGYLPVSSWIDHDETGVINNVVYSFRVYHPQPGELSLIIAHYPAMDQVWTYNLELDDDGGLDDDPETDDDIIFLNRSSDVFDGMTMESDVQDLWQLTAGDLRPGDTGYIDWFEITVYYDCAADIPLPESDPCVQEVINIDQYCCDTAWDAICDGEFWDCYGATCVEAPYPTEDECYYETVMADSFCCDTAWDSICQCAYNECTGITDQYPPNIFSAEPYNATDADGDGWLEEWNILVGIDVECGMLAPDVMIEFWPVDVDPGYGMLVGPYDFGEGVNEYINIGAGMHWSSTLFGLDTPQNITFEIHAYNDFGNDYYYLEIPVDVGCNADPDDPPYGISENSCYLQIVADDPYCCDTDWDSTCQCQYDICTGAVPPFELISISPSAVVDFDEDGYYEYWQFEVDIDTECLAVPAQDVWISVSDDIHGLWWNFGPYSFSGAYGWDAVELAWWESNMYDIFAPTDVNFQFNIYNEDYSITSYLMVPVDGDCTDSPYPDDDECYQQVIGNDPFCCENAWDTICEGEYWDCYSATCVDAPYPPEDDCYYNTVMADSFCCDVMWDAFCVCEYHACAGITSDPPLITDLSYAVDADDDTDGWAEEFELILSLTGNCGGIAHDVDIFVNFLSPDLGYYNYPLALPNDYGPGDYESITLTWWAGFNSLFFQLDEPQFITIEIIAENPYGSSSQQIQIPVDSSTCGALPDYYPMDIFCAVSTLSEVDSCCENWTESCDLEFAQCIAENPCYEFNPLVYEDDPCFYETLLEYGFGCCIWSDYCQEFYDSCVCNNIPGDVNQDGWVNVADIVQLVAFILESVAPPTDCQLMVSDLVTDGVLNVTDIVELVNMIINPVLSKGQSISEAQLFIDSSSLGFAADGNVAGIQLMTEGEFEIMTDRLPDNWELYRSENIILIFSMDGSPLSHEQLLTYRGELTILSSIIADWYGNSISASVNMPDGQFALYEAFPNPFNPITTISYSVPERSQVEITIFDMLGKKVKQFTAEEQVAGRHQVSWNADGSPSGIYFVLLQAGDYSAKRKIVLLK
ncbi:MAG: T9SS type A sorting domain-containing protein [FCB group bacterium]|nr:T9SS type A sorting domain-containing protein [FCB group bacterium]